jgi:hypothetical protein
MQSTAWPTLNKMQAPLILINPGTPLQFDLGMPGAFGTTAFLPNFSHSLSPIPQNFMGMDPSPANQIST